MVAVPPPIICFIGSGKNGKLWAPTMISQPEKQQLMGGSASYGKMYSIYLIYNDYILRYKKIAL